MLGVETQQPLLVNVGSKHLKSCEGRDNKSNFVGFWCQEKWLPCCHQSSMDKQNDKSLDKTQLNVAIVVNLNAVVTFVI